MVFDDTTANNEENVLVVRGSLAETVSSKITENVRQRACDCRAHLDSQMTLTALVSRPTEHSLPTTTYPQRRSPL